MILSLSASYYCFSKSKLGLWNWVVCFNIYTEVSQRIPCSDLPLRLSVTGEQQYFSPQLCRSILNGLPKGTEDTPYIRNKSGCIVYQAFWMPVMVWSKCLRWEPLSKPQNQCLVCHFELVCGSIGDITETDRVQRICWGGFICSFLKPHNCVTLR